MCDIERDITGRGRATFCLDKRNQRMRQRRKEFFFLLDARWILGAVIGWSIGGTGLVRGWWAFSEVGEWILVVRLKSSQWSRYADRDVGGRSILEVNCGKKSSAEEKIFRVEKECV